MNAIKAIKGYFVGSYRELRKVTWPTKKQTINYSVLVIAMSVGTAIFFSFLDYIFDLGFTNIIK
jgi:preprotein translocase subunit SecE